MSKLTINDDTVRDVVAESERALAKHGAGKVLTNVTMPRDEKLAALGEEFGEVCRALTYDNGDRANLRAELTQLGNLALAWAQAEGELMSQVQESKWGMGNPAE